MSRSFKLAVGCVLTLAWSCSESPMYSATLSMGLDVSTIDNKGQTANISLTGTDESGKPGAGSVKITSSAGSLKGDGMSVSLDSKGKGTATFSCAVSADQFCGGQITLDAIWTRSGGDKISATRRVSVVASTDGGSGGGAGGAGGGSTSDGGSIDAGDGG